MSYKTVVLDYEPKAKKMAEVVESTANKMEKEGYELITFSVTNSAKAILVFKGEKMSSKIIEAPQK